MTDAGRDADGDLRGYRNLLDCLAEVPEPRRRHGIRHRAAVVIVFAVAAILAGADSVTAITEWAADVPAEVLAALGARAVAAAFGTWVKPRSWPG